MRTIPKEEPASVDRSAAARKAWETRRAAVVPVDERAVYIRRLRASMRSAIALARGRQEKRAAAGKSSVSVSVTLDELMQKLAEQNYRCAVSALPFYTDDADRFGPSCPSLDRIDADGGYSDANLRVVYLGVNSLRGRGSDADVLRIARAIVAKAHQTM